MTDHKAEAERLALTADLTFGRIEHRNGSVGVSEGVEALIIATEAHVHATLYVAEQQRIANLIALADHSYTRWSNYAGEAGGMGTLFSNADTPDGNIKIRDDIRESLGLK